MNYRFHIYFYHCPPNLTPLPPNALNEGTPLPAGGAPPLTIFTLSPPKLCTLAFPCAPYALVLLIISLTAFSMI
jgi:hypothetical protein